MKMKTKNKLVYGHGINDADYPVQRFDYTSGKAKRIWACPIYIDWKSMLSRAYCRKVSEVNPTYEQVIVCDDWKRFSVFRNWVLSIQPNKDWENCSLDKDLLIKGNKVYSPDTCCYIPQKVNTFLIERTRDRSKVGLLGVSYDKEFGGYVAACMDPFRRVDKYIGYFHSAMEAHLAWKKKKWEYAQELAELLVDQRAAKALRERYE